MIPLHRIREIAGKIRDAAGESAEFEAGQMLRSVFVMDGTDLTPEARERLEEMIQRRLQGEPLQYILGEWEFMGLPFAVRPCALIPRPETENLCEEALTLIRQKKYKTALDLCSGTGCIGITLGKLAGVRVTCADIDPDCVELGRENARSNGVDITFACGDLFRAVEKEKYDLICCNPPYLSETDMGDLQREVRFEPELALYGGRDGMDFYRRIALSFREHLLPGGTLLLEIGAAQEKVAEFFSGAVVLKDYAGLPRIIKVEEIS